MSTAIRSDIIVGFGVASDGTLPSDEECLRRAEAVMEEMRMRRPPKDAAVTIIRKSRSWIEVRYTRG